MFMLLSIILVTQSLYGHCLSILHQPEPSGHSPQQVHLALASSPDAMVVSWVTMNSTSPVSAKYGTSEKLLKSMTRGSTVPFTFEGTTRYMHSAEMKKLTSGTKYYYKVGSPSGWSKTFSFRTFPNGTNFSFRVCIFGDLGLFSGMSIEDLKKAAKRADFDLIIHIGDIAYDMHTDGPLGNRGDLFMREMEEIFSRFNMPNDPEKANQYYSFDLGPVHFVGVSTEYINFWQKYGPSLAAKQQKWLKRDLEAAVKNRDKVPWIITYQHRPFYCSNVETHGCATYEHTIIRIGDKDIEGLEPVYTKYRVDVVFSGHVHSYERFLPMINYQLVHKRNKISPFSSAKSNPYHQSMVPIHVLTGAAGCGAGHSPFGSPIVGSAVRLNKYGYTLMTVVSPKRIVIQQISVEPGPRVVDSFTITK
ncbi:calcineurin-like phosphoesterase domain-containing protein [Ditylenchus destructor]|uniref:Purple acid phosphatase n=1 Tax=Ditylenchus destructor TaxID=166010 RepID=A0AAD4N149_9BILA|nr:calcineurin-like phosphoesterase domain-containing protein [Ditylenchus destructor]